MKLKNEAKVGLIVFAAFIGLVAMYWFLGGLNLSTSTYQISAIFPNVQKLDKGADVRLAGVKIGVVSKVTLTRSSQAKVEMLIDNGNSIPKDSMTRITTGAVIGDGFVEIVPGKSVTALKQGDRINSIPVTQLDDIMCSVGALVQEMREVAKSTNKLLTDKELITSIKTSVMDLQKTAQSASLLMISAQQLMNQTSPLINQAFDNLTAATENAVKVSEDIEQTISVDARPNIKAILAQLLKASEGLNSTMSEANATMVFLKGGADQFNSTLGKVDKTVDQANQMMTNLNQASVGIKDLATDQEIKKNLKASLQNAAEASEGAKTLIGNLNSKVGKVRTSPSAKQKAEIPNYGISNDVLWDVSNGTYRSDFNYTFGGLDKSFYRLGLYNLGENTRLNLQGGKVLDEISSFRYGIYASRIGIGYDRLLVPGFRLSADLFRPNAVQMEVRGTVKLGSSPFGLYGGVSNLFVGGKKDVLVGMQYAK